MTNSEDLAAHFAADLNTEVEHADDCPCDECARWAEHDTEGERVTEMDVAEDPADVIEIPDGAYSFVVGYLGWSRPDEVSAAVAAWNRMQAEVQQQLAAGEPGRRRPPPRPAGVGATSPLAHPGP